MAATFTAQRTVRIDGNFIVYGVIALDNSYPTGGEAIAPQTINSLMNAIHGMSLGINTAGTRLLVWDQTNQKIKCFTAVGTEAANASDQSTITDIPVTVHGS